MTLPRRIGAALLAGLAIALGGCTRGPAPKPAAGADDPAPAAAATNRIDIPPAVRQNLGITFVNGVTGIAYAPYGPWVALLSGTLVGIAIGLVRLIFDLPLIWLVVPGYLLAVILTHFSTEEFVNVAWDSAGVTTGPITVPLVLAMGLGFGNATHAVEGFGILSMASIGPIITVMITGLWSRYRARAEIRAAADSAPVAGAKLAEDFV